MEEAFKELDPDLETFDERVEYTKEVKARYVLWTCLGAWNSKLKFE